MIELICEMIQSRGIRQAQDEAQSAKSTASSFQFRAARHDREIAKLRNEVSHLALTCQALWEITRERCDLTDQDFLEKVREIDGRDGKVDGKITPNPPKQRPLPKPPKIPPIE